jgi:hypothetical protein
MLDAGEVQRFSYQAGIMGIFHDYEGFDVCERRASGTLMLRKHPRSGKLAGGALVVQRIGAHHGVCIFARFVPALRTI